MGRFLKILLVIMLATTLLGCQDGSEDRMLEVTGHGVCYGPHRDGQRPGGPAPSLEEIRQDLALMAQHWSFLRLYGSGPIAENILTAIDTDHLDLKVMLGVWIAPEADEANKQQVSAAIDLATRFPDTVVAVAVGNETQVSWSGHRSSLDKLIVYVRKVRLATRVPVTVADDFSFWLEEASRPLASELDFLTVHAHPMWNGKLLEEALPWVQQQMKAVQEFHPESKLVLGETGWATSVHNQGEQAELIQGRAGQAEQKVFFEGLRHWAEYSRKPIFWFEAFDENWKGGSHPDEVEKHWGVYQADRQPKASVLELN